MSSELLVYSTTTSSVSMCGVVSCSSFGRMVAAYEGGGSGGSGGIVALIFLFSKVPPQTF